MFSITDNERLRDAYALLMFMQSDIPASAEKRAAVKNLAATIKREIRNYNNRPAPDVHIICADYDGRLELVQLPDELDKAHKADAADWFRGNCYLEAYNSPYGGNRGRPAKKRVDGRPRPACSGKRKGGILSE